VLILLVALGITQANAADIEAGKAKSEVCAACHGSNGVSVSDNIPNLAGQKTAYLTNQLKAFRAEARKNPLMNAIAVQLADAEIENLAAFFNSLPGATGAATSEMPAEIAETRVGFPEDYRASFTHYTTISFPDRKQVRHYYANEAALGAARDGKPFPDGSVLFVEVFKAKLDDMKNPVKGADGHFVADALAAYTAMEKQPGWGDKIPEILRNGDWNYAVFTTDKTHRKGVNLATCLACHKPLVDEDYVFSLKQLQEKARM
jgi:cytochrome c553